jgi:glycosyltransferase involved in cell wall biosynthesis
VIEKKRILLVWPWFRTLAINYAEILSNDYFEVRVITSNKSWDQDESEVLMTLMREFSLWKFPLDALRIFISAKRFKPDIIFTEKYSDPRFFLLKFLKVRVKVLFIHDVIKHGIEDELTGLRKISEKFTNLKVNEVCTFSEFSQNQFTGSHRISLLPEYPISRIPNPNANLDRKNFVTFGRIYPYKNLEWLSSNWETISSRLGFEELHIYGLGHVDLSTQGVKHFNARFERDLLIDQLGRYRCAIFPYLSATQSGTLLLAHIGSVSSITSDFGGFREYQQHDSSYFTNPQSIPDIQEKLLPYLNNQYASERALLAHEHISKLISHTKKDSETLLRNILSKYTL